jgi:hypothetical protein
MTAREAIEPLQMLYLFDVVEVDKKLVFKMRGDASSQTIPLEDLSAREENQEDYNELQIFNANQNELPTAIDLKYVHFNRDYEEGSQHYELKSTPGRNHFVVNMPVVLNNTMALQAAQILLTVARTSNKRYTFSASGKYIYLVPTDVITIDSTRMRIGEIKYENGIIYFTAISEWDASTYTSSLTTQENEFDPQLVYSAAPSEMILFDIPPLIVEEDFVGFYAGAWAYEGESTYWNGTIIYRSMDGGGLWEAIGTTTNSLTAGEIINAVGEASHTCWDNGNTIDINLYDGILSSATEEAVLNGANMALIGDDGSWEVIQFMTATLNADGTYTLSDLIRGKFDTYPNISITKKNYFILFEQTTFVQILDSVENLNTEFFYRGPSIGESIQTAAWYFFTNTGLHLKPFCVNHVQATSNFLGAVTISWIRSDRFARDVEWNDYATAGIISEESEKFQIDILDGETVLNTYEVEDASEFTYTATMQTADFGITKFEENIDFKIYQMSELVGRGIEYSGSAYNYPFKYNLTPFWDDFTGTDGDVPNTTRWTRSQGDGRIYNNKFRQDIITSGAKEQLYSKFVMEGNFDCQTDYDRILGAAYSFYCMFRVETVSPAAAWHAELQVYYTYSQLRLRASTPAGAKDIAYVDPGKFRIRRNGSNMYFYVWRSGDWVLEYTETSGVPTTPMRVRYYTTNDNWPSVTVDWDNFKITGGNAYYP